MLKKSFLSKDGYNLILQFDGYYIEYTLTVNDDWNFGSKNEGEFDGVFPWDEEKVS